jgi:transcriptional regulator with XRE-family HTH domain
MQVRFRTPEEMGAAIARLREERGMSQRALGELAELDQSAVSRIEAGLRDVGAHELYRLAQVFGTTAEALLMEEDHEPVLLRAGDAEDVEITRACEAFEAAIDDYFAAIALSEYL